MPYSYPEFKNDVKNHIVQKFSKNINILDVGAGSGTYAHLLRADFANIDAVEVFERYIDEFNLRTIYRKVYQENIFAFTKLNDYDYYIFGDVIEHMHVHNAQKLLSILHNADKFMLVAVPYLYEQGAWGGNEFEIHLQPDLTKELFLHRYPMMSYLVGDDKYGYFINY